MNEERPCDIQLSEASITAWDAAVRTLAGSTDPVVPSLIRLSERRRAVPFRPIGLLWIVGTFALAGCQILQLTPAPTRIAQPAPTAIVEPAPGHVRIVSRPAAPSFPVEIRFHAVGPGGPSRDFFEFAVNEPILVVSPGVPPTSSSLQVNGVRCDGQWTFEPQVEIDVLLSFDEASCRTDVLGEHAWGAVHHEPGKDSGLEGD